MTTSALPRPWVIVGDRVDPESVQQNFDALRLDAPTYVSVGSGPAFQNSWSNFDAPGPTARDARFWRHRGMVYLEGVIDGGASGTAAFTLPTGYRPSAADRSFIVSSAGDGKAVVQVLANGNVVPSNIGGSAVTTFCYLDGIHVRVEG